MSLWALLPAAASLAGTLLSRPKKKDYIYDTSYMDKYINNLRGQRLDSQITHMIMQPALRAIGQQGARFGRSIGKYVARRKPGGGVEAQMRLSGNQQALESIQIAGEKAFKAQYGENRRIGDLIGRIEMERGRMASLSKREFSRARSQWNKDIITGGIGLAGAAGSQIAATNKAAIATLDKAKALDLVDDTTTVKEFSQLAANRGFKNMAMFTNQLARDKGTEQALNVYDPSNIPTNEAIDAGVKGGKLSATQGREMKIKKLELEGEIRQFKTFNAADTNILTKEDVISLVDKGFDPKRAQEVIDIIDAKEQMDKYVKGYAEGQIALKEHEKLFPEDMSGSLNIINKMDISGKMKLNLIDKVVTSHSKQLTSWQKEVLGTYVDQNSKSDDLRPLMFKKGGTFAESKWVAGLVMDKARIEAQGAGKAGEKYVKVAEAKTRVQITRRRLLLSQSQLVNDSDFKFVVDILDIKSPADLVSLGQNIAGVQDRLSKIAEKVKIPDTLGGYSAALNAFFTKEQTSVFGKLDSGGRKEYLKQKWQDDIMDEIIKALKAVDFPGVMNPETELGLSPAWKGIPYAPDVFGNELQLNKYQESIPEDLSIWE